MLTTLNQVQTRGKRSPYWLVMYHAWPRHKSPVRVTRFGAICVGIWEAKKLTTLLVRRCEILLSCTFSFHCEKVLFSAGVKNNSSQPSEVKFWSGIAWNDPIELDFAEEYGDDDCGNPFIVSFQLSSCDDEAGVITNWRDRERKWVRGGERESSCADSELSIRRGRDPESSLNFLMCAIYIVRPCYALYSL